LEALQRSSRENSMFPSQDIIRHLHSIEYHMSLVTNCQAWLAIWHAQKECRMDSSCPELQHEQLLSMLGEITPLHTFTATALCQICHMKPASFFPLPLVQTVDHLNWKFPGTMFIHLV
jgi:hypothetical protein